MSTLAVVEQIMRQTKTPMAVRDIVEIAGDVLPTRSKTPDTVVARDLSMEIKKHGEESRFIRTAPGRYTMREFVSSGLIQMGDSGNTPQPKNVHAAKPAAAVVPATPVLSQALAAERHGVLPAQTLPAQTLPAQTLPAQTLPAQTMGQAISSDSQDDTASRVVSALQDDVSTL